MVTHIAIILARGGSKRLPRKNILEFHGKPLIGWTIEAAKESHCYQRVLVSTDDPEIAEVGRAFGADVPFLRESAADDMTPSSGATLVALRQSEQHWGERYDYVSQLMANCPLRGAPEIEDAVMHALQSGAQSQISCFRYGWMNPWWAVRLDDQSHPDRLFPEALSMRSQDLPPLYCPTGAIWIAKTDSLKSNNTFYSDNCVFHPMSWMSAVDIDDAEDLEMANALFLAKRRKVLC